MSIFELSARIKVRPGQLEGFNQQAAEIVRLAKERDTGTLRYDWFLSSNGTQCEVREAYVKSEALIEHRMHVGEALDKLFAEVAYDHQVSLFGEVSVADPRGRPGSGIGDCRTRIYHGTAGSWSIPPQLRRHRVVSGGWRIGSGHRPS